MDLRRNEDCLSEELLAALADGTLDVPAREAAEGHLASCADCREAWAALLLAPEAGTSVPAVPVGLADRVLARLPLSGVPARSEGTMGRLIRWIPLAAAIGVMAVGAAIYGRAGTGQRMLAAEPASAGEVAAPNRPGDLGGASRALAHISLDKPLYKPGESVYGRAVLLDAFDRKLVVAPTVAIFQVKSGRGEIVYRGVSAAHEGVAPFAWKVPAEQAGGSYTLTASFPQAGFPDAEATFDLRAYRAPRLSTDLQFAHKAYGPGEKVQATLSATRAEGGIPVGATVAVVATVDGAEVTRSQGVVDALGRCTVSFTLPGEVLVGDGSLSMTVTDGGVVETAAKSIPIVVNRVALTAFPEGGDLVAGVPCRVYIEAKTPQQRPADVAGRVLDGDGKVAATFETVHEGRGRFEFTPRAGQAYRLVLDRPAGIASPFPLPTVQTEGYSLAARADSYGADDPIRVAVGAPVAGPVTVGLYLRERELALAAVRIPKGEPVEVTLTPRELVAGVLRVTVYDAKGTPRAERLVLRRPLEGLKVALSPESPGTVPGGKVRVGVKTTDALGRPVPAVLGLAATDDSVLSTIDPRERAPRLPVQALLGSEVRELFDPQAYLGTDGDSALKTDLLLGTQGWRRFAYRDVPAFVASQEMAGRRTLAMLLDPRVRDETFAATLGELGFVQFAGDLDKGARWKFAGRPEGAVAVDEVEAARAPGLARVDEERRFAEERTVVRKAEKDVPPGLREPNDPRPPVAEGKPLDGPALPPAPPAAPPAAVPAPEPAPQADPVVAAKNPEGRDFKEKLERVQEKLRDDGAKLHGEAAEAPAEIERLRDEATAAGQALALERSGYAVLGDLSGTRLAPEWVRVFAHRAPQGRAPDARTDFTETVYWNAALTTDAQGLATIEFDASDAITTIRLRADGCTRDGALAANDATIEVRRPFHVEVKFPLEVTEGDRIDLPLALSSGTPAATVATLSVTSGTGLTVRDGARDGLSIPALGSTRVIVPVEVGRFFGDVDLRAAGHAAAASDDVVRKLRVVPAGFPVERNFGGVLEKVVEHDVVVPADAVPGSISTACAIYPSPLSALTGALEALLREPGGCFEQTSSSNYPNVMALQYLKSHAGVAPELVKRAKDLLARGYQRLTSFECKSRGYEWFGGDPGHEALTAYGVMEFADMAAVMDVDADMQARTRAWLLSRRNGKGGFSRNDRALDSFGAAPQDVTDAYVLWALIESGEKGLDAEVAHLQDVAAKTEDPYVLALAGNVLVKAGDREGAKRILDRLAKAQAKDGASKGASTSITRSGGESLEIETTSLAVLGWLKFPEHVSNVESAMRWLAARCKAGRFGSTQATILALKAVVAYDAAHAKERAAGTVIVEVDDAVVEKIPFTAGREEPIVIGDLGSKLGAGSHRIRLRMEGGSDLPYSFALRYYALTPDSSKSAKVTFSVALPKAEAIEGDPVGLAVRVKNATSEGIPMVTAVVGLPGGLEARPDALKDLVKSGTVDAIETRGREVILYWRSMAPSAETSFTVPCVAAVPGTYTGPASRAYLYYTDEHKVWVPGVRVSIRAR